MISNLDGSVYSKKLTDVTSYSSWSSQGTRQRYGYYSRIGADVEAEDMCK
jgi:hypothetical protein